MSAIDVFAKYTCPKCGARGKTETIAMVIKLSDITTMIKSICTKCTTNLGMDNIEIIKMRQRGTPEDILKQDVNRQMDQ